METRKESIKAAIHQVMRIAGKYARIERMPIPVDLNVVVSTAEVHTIEAIGENDRMRGIDVAAYFGISKSAASQMVSRLIAKGFLQKKRSPSNNKEFRLTLTELGWRAFEAHDKLHGKDMTDLVTRLSAFSPSQIETVTLFLDAIGHVMDERLSEQGKE